jgi:NAD(P)-dependent dehydrogenase (short-subunit alcohol dehydrogenase family)
LTAELEGRTALVTGGSSDIGMATARALAARGADVAIHCHSGVDNAEAVCAEVLRLGRRATVLRADLTSYADTRRLADEALAFAPIDILVNNAGNILKRVHWMELEPNHLDRVFGLNFRAPLFLVQSLSPGMIERGRGVVINVLSTAAWSGGSNTVFAYGTAKGALHTLTQGLARELAPRGVRVLAVAPGTIDTAFQREPVNVEYWKQWVGNIPVGRIGRPEEIGEVVAFMATDAASFIIGETIHVNGGIFMS